MKSNFKIHRLFLKILLALIILAVIGVLAFVGLQISGKKRLYEKNGDKRPDLSGALTSIDLSSVDENESGEGSESDKKANSASLIVEEESDNWEEGDVRYNGVHYRYNSEMLTFLFLGIDKDGTVKKAKNGIDGGQSDVLMLLAVNPKTKVASLINIHRDTMADVDIYDEDGNYLGTTKKMITLQHGYGDGKELSCERSVNAVSRLFYNMPIHGYCAINMGAIPKINDAVGGVEVVIQDDLEYNGKILYKAGQTVKLKGNAATAFLRSRDCNEFGSAGKRSDRQKQYIKAYAAAATKAIKNDVTVLAKLYNTISKYMVTNITVDEVSYFSTQVGDYSFGDANIYSLKGETIMGEKFEEYHLDEKALLELVLEVFYDVIDD